MMVREFRIKPTHQVSRKGVYGVSSLSGWANHLLGSDVALGTNYCLHVHSVPHKHLRAFANGQSIFRVTGCLDLSLFSATSCLKLEGLGTGVGSCGIHLANRETVR